MEEKVRNRVFDRCVTCDRDIARWTEGTVWWHLDGHIILGHLPLPKSQRS